MANVFNLLESADSFYKKALWAYFWASSFLKKAEDDLVAESEKFDIKDEELFNQFEAFMSSYKELIDTLKIDPSNLNTETMEDAGQLIDALNTRYERIMNNPYLNMGEEGYEEDFNPGEFTAFIQKVVNDAGQKLNNIAGENIDISEIGAAQIAKELNQVMLDRGDTKMTYTGNKVQQLLEAKRTWFKNLMFIKKVGKTHPEYHRYQKYVEGRTLEYQRIQERLRTDPDFAATFRGKLLERKKKYWKNTEKEIQTLEAKLRTETDPKKIEQMKARLVYLRSRYDRAKEALKVKKLKESGNLQGKIVHLQQKLASLKKDTAKIVKDKAAQDPYFTPFKQAVRMAKERLDQEASPANQELLEDATRKEAEAIKNYLETNQAVVKVKEDLVKLYSFRDNLKTLYDAGWSDAEPLPEESKILVHQLKVEGEKLTVMYGRIYRGISATIQEIISILTTKL